MTHGPTRFESKGCCIYCGARGVELSDEHIVPYSLGGHHVIANASCHSCADVTKKFEQDVARGMWGDARVSYDAPSRRKKQRPKSLVFNDPENPRRKICVPYAEYPAPLIFYKMSNAGLLEGLSETTDISHLWQFIGLVDDVKAKQFEEKFGIKLSVKFRHVPDSFARMIAKIGYGHILSILDLCDFRSLCVPYILGQKKNLSYIVGGSFNSPAPEIDKGYVLNTVGFGDANRIMLIAEVRLFANNETPAYHVLVGEALGTAQVSSVMKKLGQVEFMTLPQGLEIAPQALDTCHWSPRVWPLPFWSG